MNCLFETLIVCEITFCGVEFGGTFSGSSSMETLQLTVVPLSILNLNSTEWFLNMYGTVSISCNLNVWFT